MEAKKKESVPVPERISLVVDAMIIKTPPEGGIVPLPRVMDAQGADRRDYKTKRLVSRAMHLRGAETFTSPNRSGGSYLVTPEAREAVLAMKRKVSA